MSDAAKPETPEELIAAVGAILFASGEPVSSKELAAAFEDVEPERLEEALAELEAIHERAGAGLRLERIAGGYRLATESRVGARVRSFFRQRNRARLSAAALETLAIVAYRQPVTAPEIQAIRGKDPSAALKSLVEKRMLRILGRKKVVGSPLLYGTSKQFLVHFGLDSLKDLPSIEEFDAFVDVLEAGQGQLFEQEGAGEGGEHDAPDDATDDAPDDALQAAGGDDDALEGEASRDDDDDSPRYGGAGDPPPVRVDPPSAGDH